MEVKLTDHPEETCFRCGITQKKEGKPLLWVEDIDDSDEWGDHTVFAVCKDCLLFFVRKLEEFEVKENGS